MKDDLLLYNTLTHKKEVFKPISDNVVTLYSCGPTVYSTPHIGNMRAYSFVDMLVRTLTIVGYKVNNIINITDVGHLTSDADDGDDKIEKSARLKNLTAYDVADEYTNIFFRYLKELNVLEPMAFPKATDHIDEQINMIKVLEEKGYTYITDDGVYFDTTQFSSYCDFAKINVDGLREGSRVDFGQKKNTTDFALWKFSSDSEHRDMEWNSPWGKGFPGWHIECSAMAMKYLGKNIDIHTGGIDHIHIHHTNEIAQSEAYSDEKFVNYWMHVNFLQIEKSKEDVLESTDEPIKMSKSKGTAYTIDDLKARGFDPLSLKFLYLTAHYRSELKFNFEILESAEKTFKKIQNRYYDLKNKIDVSQFSNNNIDKYMLRFMLNDLDTRTTLAYFHNVISDPLVSDSIKMNAFYTFEQLFGFNFSEYTPEKNIVPEFILKMAEERSKFKNEKNWSKADEIRREIVSLGYFIEDQGAEFKIIKREKKDLL